MSQIFLVLFLFLLSVSRPAMAFWLALLAGFFLDLFSASPFGLLSASLLLSLAGAHFLFAFFFTNRSLPALLMLGLCGTLLFHLIFAILNLAAMIKIDTNFSFSLNDYFIITLKKMFYNTILLFLLFTITNRFSRRLKAIFLVK